MNEDKIQAYVDSNKDKYPRESIENQLLEIGASKEQIDKAFAGTLLSQSTTKKNSKKTMIIFSIVGVLILLGILFYFFSSSSDSNSASDPLGEKTDEEIQKILQENPNDEEEELVPDPVPEQGGEPIIEIESIDSPDDEILAEKLEICEPYIGVDVVNNAILDSEVFGIEDEKCKFIQENSIAEDAFLVCYFSEEERFEMAKFIRNSSYRVGGESPIDVGIGNGNCKIPGYID